MSDLETIFTKIQAQPYLLNSLTGKYLQTMSSAFNNSVMRWQELNEIMHILEGDEEQISQNKSLLLMNTLRIVLMETFPTVQLNTNRLYTWLFMHYGVRMNKIIRILEGIAENIEESGVSEDSRYSLHEAIAFGLGYTEIIYCILENYIKKSPTNKTLLPEFYRFVWVSLELIQQFSSKIKMKIKLPNLGISETQPSTEQNEQEMQNENQQGIKTQQTIKITQIFKMLNIIKKNPNKKVEGKIEAAIFYKSVELLEKIFRCCKKKSIKQVGLVKKEISCVVQKLFDKIVTQNEGDNNSKNKENKKEEIIFEIKSRINKYLIKARVLQMNNQGFADEEGKMIEEQKLLSEEQDEHSNQIIEVRQLTPRFINEQPAMEIKKLKKKKNKLMKKIESDIRRSTFNKVQQQRVLEDVRHERSTKREKKEIFILQKQTEEAKKVHKQAKKIKMIQKDAKKGSKKGGLGPMKKK